MTFERQWLESMALEIEQNYINERDPDISTVVDQIVEFIRRWNK